MGMRLSDPRPPLPNYCWGASILEKLHGRHVAPVGERYCAECKAKNAAVVAALKADGVAAASMQVPGATDRGSSAATPVPSSGPIRPDAAVVSLEARTVLRHGRGTFSTGPGVSAPSACEPRTGRAPGGSSAPLAPQPCPDRGPTTS